MDGAETYDWDPGARGTDLRGDSTNVAPDRQPDEVFAARPLQRSLVISNYTFDAVITLPSSAGIRYLPVRGLWDTGSDVYLISRNVLQRANIGDEDLEHVADKTTLHGIGGAVLAPEWKVQLTWHVKRNMNSRQDTFYVADDISCDMLVPWTLNIGSRYTGMGTPGQNALILQLRRKSNVERDQERKRDEAAFSVAEAAARKKMDERRRARLREIQERQQNANRTPAP